MALLLDTHALLWFISGSEKLSASARDAIMDSDNRVFISLVSVWEIQIKVQLGKLTVDEPLAQLIEAQQMENGLNLLPIEASHIYRLDNLPNHHRDPFDRLLIAQAIAEDYTLVTKDGHIHAYQDQVKLLW